MAGAALALALLALLAPAGASADPPLRHSPQVTDLARGLICSPPETGRRDAPDTMAGWIHVPDEPLRIIEKSTTAPAVLGMGFGVEFRLTGDVPLLVRYSVTHPPMPPEGRTRQGWDGTVWPDRDEAVFFLFDIEEELQPGRWSFSASHDGTEIFHAAFDVVAPEEAQHLTGLCRDGGLLSFVRP